MFKVILVILLFFVVIVWASARQARNNLNTTEYIPPTEESKHYAEFHNNSIIREHFENLPIIEAKYSFLYNLKRFHGPEMDELIELCKRDIFIADEFVSLFKYYKQEVPTTYGTFKRLAIIYEKRGEIGKAIDVCVEAIELGFTDKDMMYGRLARLLRKNGYPELAEKYERHSK